MRGEQLVQARVPLVDDARDLATAPRRHDLEAHLQHSGDRPQAPDRHVAQVAALDPRDPRPIDAGAGRDVLLPKSTPNPHGPQERPETLVVHRAIMRLGPYPPITAHESAGAAARWEPPSRRSASRVRGSAYITGQFLGLDGGLAIMYGRRGATLPPPGRIVDGTPPDQRSRLMSGPAAIPSTIPPITAA